MATGGPPVMELQGFNLDEGDGDPIEIVLNFCENIPDTLLGIFDNSSFRDLINSISTQTGIDDFLFFNAFAEARQTLSANLTDIRNRLNATPEYRDQLYQQLEQIGFTGSSLELKAKIFNWRLRELINRAVQGFIDFTVKPIVKLLRKLLSFLNKLFESLKIVIPGIEAIKEIKDVGEEYAAVAEEGAAPRE